MILDKAIAHGKEHRKPYRGSKSVDPTCRNHGGCDWCTENRTVKYRRTEERFDSMEDDAKIADVGNDIEDDVMWLLSGCVSKDYAGELRDVILDDVVDDVRLNSALAEGGYYSDTDVRYAIGRVLLSMLGKM